MFLSILLTGGAGVWAFVVLPSEVVLHLPAQRSVDFRWAETYNWIRKNSGLQDRPWRKRITHSLARGGDAIRPEQHDH